MPLLPILLFLLTVVTSHSLAQEPAAPPTIPAPDVVAPSQIEALLDGVVIALQHEHRLPGLTVSVVRDDALLIARGYGLAEIAENRPVDPEATLFRIGSPMPPTSSRARPAPASPSFATGPAPSSPSPMARACTPTSAPASSTRRRR